jgi:hypothetical protein
MLVDQAVLADRSFHEIQVTLHWGHLVNPRVSFDPAGYRYSTNYFKLAGDLDLLDPLPSHSADFS